MQLRGFGVLECKGFGTSQRGAGGGLWRAYSTHVRHVLKPVAG